MRNRKLLLLPALILASALPAWAVPAKRDLMTFTQPDGTQISARLVGDERAHLLLSTDGSILAEKDGAYYFANLSSDGRLVSTNVLAADPEMRNELQKNAAFRLSESETIEFARKRSAAKPRHYDLENARNAADQSSLPQFGMGRTHSAFSNKGECRALVILVEYKDIKFSVDDPSGYFTDMLNKDGFDRYGGTGCAAEYFRFNSNNQFIPTFDVLGPVTLKYNRSYYGANDAWGNDQAAEEMVVEAIKALDPTVDFSVYDMDKDGNVDNVFIFYAGVGEASSGLASSVWPHAYALEYSNRKFQVDNVWINDYGCTNELYGTRPDGVGTFIHEFSHVIGLPDLYDTAGSLTCTPDFWSALDYGPYNNDGRTPPNYSTYERNAMQWLEPELISEAETITLRNLADNYEARIMQTDKPNEFFLFENRQQLGWDEYLPGHGMLVWHIDYNKDVFEKNAVNNSSSHQYVHLVKANNIHSTGSGSEATKILAGWSWPGTSGNTELTPTTLPSLTSWSGKPINLPITQITEENGIIRFLVDGGGSRLQKPVLIEPDEDEIGEDWFIAKWEPVEFATDYLLTVSERESAALEETEVADMGIGSNFSLPEGWTSTKEDIYSTAGNYGESAPSMKMNSDGVSLTTRMFAGDISEIEFWAKGQQNDGSTLEITGIKEDGSTINIENLTPAANEGKTYLFRELPAGIRQVRFRWNKSKGNLALDDVKIVVGGGTVTVLDEYNGVSTNGETSVKVSNLKPGKFYSFSVVATDGDDHSKPSKTVLVILKGGSGVGSIAENVVVKVTGRQLSSESPVSVYDLSGSVLADGVKDYTFGAPGLYLIRTANKTLKLIVK